MKPSSWISGDLHQQRSWLQMHYQVIYISFINYVLIKNRKTIVGNEEWKGQLIVAILIFMTIFYLAAILRKLDYRRIIEQRRTNHFTFVTVSITKLFKWIRNKIKRLLSTYLNYYPRYFLYKMLLLTKLNFPLLICFKWNRLFRNYLNPIQTTLI